MDLRGGSLNVKIGCLVLLIAFFAGWKNLITYFQPPGQHFVNVPLAKIESNTVVGVDTGGEAFRQGAFDIEIPVGVLKTPCYIRSYSAWWHAHTAVLALFCILFGLLLSRLEAPGAAARWGARA